MATLPGVFLSKKKDGTTTYRASITIRNKHISLGTYPSEEDAHDAYCEAKSLLTKELPNLSNYIHEEHCLDFSKKVTLVNFIKNGVYIKTPILLKDNYFLYYLTPDLTLKFDVDDLFFYSTHKIMKRGGHLFVSDYGMQLNILSRYGIKNFAVIDRDYRFVNGDICDFRYKNIEVVNKYYGVQKFLQNGVFRYLAAIHINGNFQIGIYETEAEAAIAYNKAVDTLNRNGLKKNYFKNYVIEVDEIAYSSLYNKIKISKKIREL